MNTFNHCNCPNCETRAQKLRLRFLSSGGGITVKGVRHDRLRQIEAAVVHLSQVQSLAESDAQFHAIDHQIQRFEAEAEFIRKNL